MNSKNKDIEHSDQSCSHKKNRTPSDSKNVVDIKDTSDDQRIKLPLPRDFVKFDDDSVKIYESCEIFQNPGSASTITIVREITEEVFDDESGKESESEGKHKYCREVIRPFLKTAPLDCPDDEELLVKEGLDSAPDEIPDLQPCVGDQYVGCSKAEGIKNSKTDVGSSNKKIKNDKEKHDSSAKKHKECARKSDSSSKNIGNIKIQNVSVKTHQENTKEDVCENKYTAKKYKDDVNTDSSTIKSKEVTKKDKTSETSKNYIRKDDSLTKKCTRVKNEDYFSKGKQETIAINEKIHSKISASDTSSSTPEIIGQEDSSSQTELIFCDDVTKKSSSQSEPVQILEKSDTTYLEVIGDSKDNDMESLKTDTDKNNREEHSDKVSSKPVTRTIFDYCTNKTHKDSSQICICPGNELKQVYCADELKEKLSQKCKNQNKNFSHIIGGRQCHKTTICTVITSKTCPVHTQNDPEACSSNESVESSSSFGSPIVSADSRQSSRGSVVSADSGCDSPKKTINKCDSESKPKCKKYKLPESERVPCFPEKDRSLLTILKKKICPECSQESSPCQSKSSKPCLPKNRHPCCPKKPEPCPPKEPDPCCHKKPKPCPPKDFDPCSLKNPEPCPPKDFDPCSLKNPKPCPPREPDPCPQREPDPCPPKVPDPCPHREPNPCPLKEPIPCPPKESFPCPPKDPNPCPSREGGFCGSLFGYISSKVCNNKPDKKDPCPLKERPFSPKKCPEDPDPCLQNEPCPPCPLCPDVNHLKTSKVCPPKNTKDSQDSNPPKASNATPIKEPYPCTPACKTSIYQSIKSNICTSINDTDASSTNKSELSSSCRTKPPSCTPSKSAFDDFSANLIKSHQKTVATLLYVAEDLMNKAKAVTQDPQAMNNAKCAAEEIITECDKFVRQKTKELSDIAKGSETEQKTKSVVTRVCETTKEVCTKTTEACKKKVSDSKKWLGLDDDDGKKKPRNTCSGPIPGRNSGITSVTDDKDADDYEDSVFSKVSSKIGSAVSSVTPDFGNMKFNYNDDESSAYDQPTSPSDCPKDVNMMFSEIGALLNEPQVILNNTISAIKETLYSMFHDAQAPEPETSAMSGLIVSSHSLEEKISLEDSEDEDPE